MQVKSYFQGQIRTLGQNMDVLMAQLREEHLRPRGLNHMDRGYYPDTAEPALRGSFGGCFPEPSRVSEAGPSNPVLYPQQDRPDSLHSETTQ